MVTATCRACGNTKGHPGKGEEPLRCPKCGKVW